MTEARAKSNLVGCVKCGAPNGFVESEPHYHSQGRNSISNLFKEWLEWSCTVCGYTVTTKVFIPEAKKSER